MSEFYQLGGNNLELGKSLSTNSLLNGSRTSKPANTSSFSLGNISGAIDAGANVIGAIGSSFGAYWGYKNGKAQAKAMQQQVDLMDKQMQIENERYNKRESERLENNASLQADGAKFSQEVEKKLGSSSSSSDLPMNRI